MEGATGGEHRTERVVFETDQHRVVGNVTLPPEGYQSRFSDLLNRVDFGFIALVDVEVSSLEGGDFKRYPFLALGKAHIRVVYPLPQGE